MTRKTIGYTHLQWTCPSCGHKNPGAAEKCLSCQAPQPEDVQFEQPAQEKLVQDETLIQRAQAGADIHCPYCGTRNSANATTCRQCGGDLTEGAARTSGQVLGAHRRQAASDVACAFCGTLNPAEALTCSNCGAALTTVKPERPLAATATTSRPTARSGMSPVIIGIIVLACLGGAVLLFLFNRTDEVIGRVESVNWERTIVVEELGLVSREEWLNEIPAEADVGACTSRVHHTQSSPAPGATEICGTPYTLDTGTGLGEVVQDCEYQVYADWCEYTALEWQTADELTTTGTDYTPLWPQLSLNQEQREGEREESYRVSFNVDGEDYTYGTSSLDRFQRFEVGSDWILEVNTFDMVVGVSPAP